MDSADCRNRPCFEGGAINGRFQITWQIFLENKMDTAPANGGISAGK